jgi:hypothetical protein
MKNNKPGPLAQPKSTYFHLNITLPNELDVAIADVGNRARASGGRKIRKTEVLRALVRFMIELDVDVSGVKSEDDFFSRLRDAFLSK